MTAGIARAPRRRALAATLAVLATCAVVFASPAHARAASPARAVQGQGPHDVPVFRASGRTIRVPQNAGTIQAAVDRAKKGDLVLVDAGVYREAVHVTKPGIVIRGVDRNRTILEGDFERADGIFVDGANGVAVENLTARDYTVNGFYWKSVLGYRGSYLTAYRNGDYGVYAFDSQYGQFDHSYASGSPDSGFYIGQCNPCHAVIDDVVAEHNQLGYSGTNASTDLAIVRSIWRANRAGIVPNTLDEEELPPQGHMTIAGNLVRANGDAGAARGDEKEFDAVFGGGIVVVGGVGDTVARNRVVANAKIGIAIAPNPGLQKSTWLSTGNHVTDNVVSRSGLVDLALLLPGAGDGNCFAGNRFASSAPTAIQTVKPCFGASSGDLQAGALDIVAFLDTSKNPPGVPYNETPAPPEQRSMPDPSHARARPAGAPERINLAKIRVPADA